MQSDTHLTTEPNLRCFACGHRYQYLGTGVHPGVCPSCGLRAVSFAGSVEVTAVNAGDALGQEGMAEVSLEDATDRVVTFYVTLDEDEQVASLYVARIEDTRLTPQSPHWSSALVPDALRTFIASADGFEMELRVPNTGPERGA